MLANCIDGACEIFTAGTRLESNPDLEDAEGKVLAGNTQILAYFMLGEYAPLRKEQAELVTDASR